MEEFIQNVAKEYLHGRKMEVNKAQEVITVFQNYEDNQSAQETFLKW